MDTTLPAPDPDDTVIDELEPGLRDPYAPVDERFVPAAVALEGMGLALWRLGLNVRTGATGVFRWMQAPNLGDLVMVYLAPQHPIHRVGIYRSAWSEGGPWEGTAPAVRGRFQEVYMIETLDGRGITWTNCQLIRLPSSDAEQRAMLARS